jgi:hypothetical protein
MLSWAMRASERQRSRRNWYEPLVALVEQANDRGAQWHLACAYGVQAPSERVLQWRR